MAKKAEAPKQKTGVAAWNEEHGTAPRQGKAQSEKRFRIGALIALAAFCVACVVCFLPLKQSITRGLWLKEGEEVTLKVTAEDGSAPSTDDLASAAKTIRARLGKTGLSEYDVQTKGDDAIVVLLPWNTDAESIARAVGGTGKIEFARLDEVSDADALVKINAGTSNVQLKDGSYTPFLDGSSIDSIDVIGIGEDYYAITIHFNDEGKEAMAKVTKELAEDSGRIALLVDGAVSTAPSVSEEITEGQVSLSGFSEVEANAFKAVHDTGALPVKTTVEGSAQTDALLGDQMLWGLVIGTVVAIVAVTAFAFTRLGRLAVLVGGALAVYSLVILGLMALGSRSNMFVLTMPGVVGGLCAAALTAAAVWLMVVDFHKKIADGRNVRGAAMSAPHDGMQRLLLPTCAAVVACLVLMFVPVAMLREFGTTFVLGAVSGVVSVFWFAVTSLRLLASGAIPADPGAWGAKTNATNNAVGAKES
jgi:preprotein translocase subunit SecD/SecD/SecF fusion protein